MAIDDYQHADYKTADDRGRITLGKDHAHATVAVAWTELDPPDPEHAQRPPKEEQDKLTELHAWATEHDHKALDFDVENGRIYNEEARWVDTDVEGLGE